MPELQDIYRWFKLISGKRKLFAKTKTKEWIITATLISSHKAMSTNTFLIDFPGSVPSIVSWSMRLLTRCNETRIWTSLVSIQLLGATSMTGFLKEEEGKAINSFTGTFSPKMNCLHWRSKSVIFRSSILRINTEKIIRASLMKMNTRTTNRTRPAKKNQLKMRNKMLQGILAWHHPLRNKSKFRQIKRPS